MSEKLRGLLHELSDHETRVAATADTDAVADALRAQVRRHRTRRYAGVGAAAAAVAAGVVAVSTLTTSAPPIPAEPDPTPTVTVSPGPGPTPEPTAAPRVPLGEVTVHPALPTAEGLAAGDLEASTSDWTLTLVEAITEDDPPPRVLYLLGPEGQRYEVPTPVSWEGRYLDDWLPGTTLVLVGDDAGAPELSRAAAPWVLLDVLTGEVLTTITVPEPDSGQVLPTVDFVGDGTHDVLLASVEPTDAPGRVIHHARRLAPDGTVVTEMEPSTFEGGFDAPATVSPDGAWVLLRTWLGVEVRSTSDLSADAPGALPHTEAPERCAPGSWLGGSELAVLCNPDGRWDVSAETVETWAVDLAGGAPTLLATGPRTDAQWRVGQQVIGSHSRLEGDSWAELLRLSPGPVEPVAITGFEGSVRHVSGGRLWVDVRDGDDLDLVAVDPRTGATQLLWPDVFASDRVSIRMLP